MTEEISYEVKYRYYQNRCYTEIIECGSIKEAIDIITELRKSINDNNVVKYNKVTISPLSSSIMKEIDD